MARTTCGECIFSVSNKGPDRPWDTWEKVECRVSPSPVMQHHKYWCGAGRARATKADRSWLWWLILGIATGVSNVFLWRVL